MKCTKCGEHVGTFFKFCANCGEPVAQSPEEHGLFVIDHEKLEEAVRAGRIQAISMEETCVHILRGLINYHKRMTMGYYPERDFYVDALEYALKCVEEKMK